MAFDGTGDHGVSRRLVSGDFTIEFWFRSTQVAGPGTTWWSGRGIVDASTLPHSGEPFYDGFGVSLGAGRILFGTGGGFETTLRSGFVADGRWHHVAATRVMESGTMTLHVDGIRVDEGTGSQTPLDAASNMTVGAMQWAWGAWPFWGAVDEIRVWDVARTDAEIARNYECSDLTHPHLLTYWRMNEGAGSLARSSGAFSSSLVLDGRVGWVPSGAVVDRCRFGRLVDEESMRRLWDLGSDPGSTWAQPGFPDAHWIGAQGTLLPTEGTNGTGLRPDAITYYFRQPFQVSDPASIASVMLQMTRVDGAIVYLNGMEVLRYGMPTGAIDHLTWALPSGTNISTTGVSRIFETLSADWLVAGINWLAVEVHRAGPSNAGLLFDASLFSIPREPACGRNQLVNGSFETPGVPDGFVTLPNGSAILPGWRPILDGAGYRNLAASVVPGLEADSRAADGNHLVDLTPGKVRGRGVQQTLATVPGRVYRVSFALGTARSNGGSGRSSLAASVAGNTYAFNVTAEGSAVAWEAKQFSFAAETSETTLAFYTVDADTQCFVGLDQVSVTDCCSDSTLKISLHAYGQGPNR